MRLWYVSLLTILIVTWLSVGLISPGNYSPRKWHIIHWTWGKHGFDCAVCVEDMVFIRGDGPRAGERCRVILPESMRGDI